MRIILLFVVFSIDVFLAAVIVSLIKVVFLRKKMFFSETNKMVVLLLVSLFSLGLSLLIHIRFAPYYTNIRYFSIIGIIALLSFFRKR